MNKPELPPEFLELLKKVQGKRSRVVVEHILEHGFITTEDLENIYGYSHPPRAIRDVREQGIPLESFRVKNEQGRTISAYRFGDLAEADLARFGGRRSFSKEFKRKLITKQEKRCAICNSLFEERYLQIDHRVPYEVSGETSGKDEADYMLLCASCNRAKAWSCQHCENSKIKKIESCQSCYWAAPLSYEHIALQPFRRLELVFGVKEIELFDLLSEKAKQAQMSLAEYIKRLLSDLSQES